MPDLGTLESVNIREVWEGEASHFTPWLAQPENLELLGDTLGVSLDRLGTETPVGRFSADIVCRNLNDNSTVLIENQLEKTDHRHLGQIFTYAAGLDAVTIIWIAPQFTDEHRAAIDWLNRITSEEFSFFALEIEVWRIADSPAAPRFNVVVEPNDWARAIKRRKTGDPTPVGETSELRLQQLAFWEGFKDYLTNARSPIHCQKPGHRHWMWHSIGRTGIALCSVVLSSSNPADPGDVRAEFVIHEDPDGSRMEALRSLLPALEERLGQSISFDPAPDGAKRSKMYVTTRAPWSAPEKAPEVYEWLDQTHRNFLDVLKPHLQTV